MAARVSERSIGEIRAKTNTRAKNRKSRGGCSFCKAKRLKCDETHPSCKQCTRRGQECPGYQKQYRWSTVHEKARPSAPDGAFWPQAEHNALLDTLPQRQCCGTHVRESIAEPPTVEKEVLEATPGSPLLANPPPEIEDDVFATGSTSAPGGTLFHEEEDSLRLPSVTNVDDFASWSTLDNEGLFDDHIFTHDENISVRDIFSDLCDLSPSNDEVVQEQQEPTGHALTFTSPKPPKLLYTPVDLSTMLMEYWFSDVCSMWSAFDSPANPHRQLASSAWQHSQAVYFALQSMSAACLVDSLPHIKKHIGALSSQAVEAIQLGVRAHKQLGSDVKNTFPRELLLAIIAMGTSVCWTDTRQLGLWFLGKAHELLAQYEDETSQLDSYGWQELEYFREALVYWEMLYRVVGSDPRGHLKRKKDVYKRRLLQAMSSDEPSRQCNRLDLDQPFAPEPRPGKNLTIHPWTGISTDIQHTFGLVFLLCRDYCTAERKQEKRTTAALSGALCDIKMAQDFARELAQTDVYSGEHSPSPLTRSKGTGDNITPIRHLVDTAEAYRLAGLLVLSQTFPDLDMDRMMDDTDTQGSNDAGNAHATLALAMRLVETLRRVPAESGTRCIHPILYICAGAGMKFDSIPRDSRSPNRDDSIFGSSAHRQSTASSGGTAQLDLVPLSATHRPAVADFNTASVTSCTIEVSRGRRFIVDRLVALQRSLPPRPIGVALDLVKAVWNEYDYNIGRDPSHWIDVMVDKGFQTLFG